MRSGPPRIIFLLTQSLLIRDLNYICKIFSPSGRHLGQRAKSTLEGRAEGGDCRTSCRRGRLPNDLGKGMLSKAGRASFPVVSGSSRPQCVPLQLGHDGGSPESCWLVEELSLAVPTQGTKYTLRCNCWLAKDRGDGVTSRVFDLLDATVVNIGVKVWRGLCMCLARLEQCTPGWAAVGR